MRLMGADPVSGMEVVEAIGTDLIVDVIGVPPDHVVDVTHDSRQVAPDCVFVCLPGSTHDGHDFAGSAIAAGATMVIVERLLDGAALAGVAQVLVTDGRRAMARAARVVHGDPAASLSMVAVTGTNGKTTTAHLIGAVLTATGRHVEVLGTLSGQRTTPESTDLQRSLAGFLRDGVDTVVMEVSSHALVLDRVDGIVFDVAVFTNLGRDHLDLHGSMEAYFAAKASLFRPALARRGVANRDDAAGRRLLASASIPMVGFSLEDATDASVETGEVRFGWRGCDVVVPLGGAFNVSNALAALTAVVEFGVGAEAAVQGIATAAAVPGRFESIGHPDAPVAVIVDYAHTPDGLEQVLRTARVSTEGRLVVVVGCGGDRDRDKRPEMGRVAAELADLVVVTSDNPRSEEPGDIIAQIVAGVPVELIERIEVEPDRRAAIERAVFGACDGDVVVVAGKGHETTQVIAGVAYEFDDRIVAREALGRRVR